MAQIAFKNILDEEVQYDVIDKATLYECVLHYATKQEDELSYSILYEEISILVNDKVIDPSFWGTTKVSDEDRVVITPGLKGGKNKSILMLVAAFAIVLAAPYIGPYLAPGGSTFMGMTAAQITSKVVMFGVGLAFNALSGLLFAPKLPKLDGGGFADSQTYNWSGIKTTATEDTPISIIYGTHIVGGNVISIFTEADGRTNYLNMLIALGEGPIDGICQEGNSSAVCLTTDAEDDLYAAPAIWIDDQPLSNYEEIAWKYRVGKNNATTDGVWALSTFYRKGDTVTAGYYCIEDHVSAANTEPGVGVDYEDYWHLTTPLQHCPFLQTKIAGFDRAKNQINLDSNIRSKDYVYYTTTKDVDGIYIETRAPSLYTTNIKEGAIQPHSIKFSIEYKKTSEGTYNLYTLNKYSPDSYRINPGMASDGDDGPTTTWNDRLYWYGTKPPQRYNVTIIDAEEDGEFVETWDVKDGLYVEKWVRNDNKKMTIEIEEIGTGKIETREIQPLTGITLDLTAIEAYNDIIIGPYKVHFYPFGEMGQIGYKFRLEPKNLGAASEVEMRDKAKSNVFLTVPVNFDDRDTYDLRFIRTDGGPSDSFHTSDQLMLTSITEMVDGSFIYPNVALLALKIKATENIAGSPPNIKTLVRGLKIEVPDVKISGGDEKRFDTTIWDGSDWKDDYGAGSKLTWDGTTYRDEEFTNNAILVLRDLLLSTRYGLGDYLSSTDLYETQMEETIQDCSKNYIPYSTDTELLTWWSTASSWGNPGTWFNSGSTKGVTFTETPATKLSVDGGSENNSTAKIKFWVNGNLDPNYIYEVSFDITINSGTINKLAFNLEHGIYGSSFDKNYKEWTSLTSTSYSHIFSPDLPVSRNLIILRFSNTNGTPLGNFDISNLSLKIKGTKSEKYHTWDGVLDSSQAAITALLEMCSSFRCWPIWYGGKFNFIINKNDSPIHVLSKGNTISFDQSFTSLTEIPSRLIGQFLDKDMNYDLRSIKAISDESSLNKLNVANIGLRGITSMAKASRELKFMLNQMINCTHGISIKCGAEHLHATAGDVIAVQDDLPQWGHGGRLLGYTATNMTIDSEYTFNDVTTASFIIKYQLDDNSFTTATLDITADNEGSTLQIIPIKSLPDTPNDDAVYQLGKTTTYYQPFRIIAAQRIAEDQVELQALNHVASIYDEETDIKVISDKHTPEIPLTGIPAPPKNVSVRVTNPNEGIGFIFGATPSDSITTSIKVFMSTDQFYGYEELLSINMESGMSKYINNNLSTIQGENTYYFRFYSYSSRGKISIPSQTLTIVLDQYLYKAPAPTGLRVQGEDPNYVDADGNHLFDGKDLTISWNSVGNSSGLAFAIKGYKVKVYKESISSSNFLREEFVSGTSWIYTLDDNISDGGPFPLLAIEIYSITSSSTTSETPSKLTVKNSIPNDITNLSAASTVGGITFTWDKNTETDLEGYEYQIKIGSGDYSGSTYTLSFDITVASGTIEYLRLQMSHAGSDQVYYEWTNVTTGSYSCTFSPSTNVENEEIFLRFYQTSGIALGTFDISNMSLQLVGDVTELFSWWSSATAWDDGWRDTGVTSPTVTVTDTATSKITVTGGSGSDERVKLGFYSDEELYGNLPLITDNRFTRILTNSEITSYGNKATVYFRVRSKDLYDQISDFSSTSLTANTITDDLFILYASKSGGTGNVASLYDGNTSSGGVTIA